MKEVKQMKTELQVSVIYIKDDANDIMRIIAQLKELEWIVCDKDLTAKYAQSYLKELMLKQIENYSKD